jgi:hypothetical protein
VGAACGCGRRPQLGRRRPCPRRAATALSLWTAVPTDLPAAPRRSSRVDAWTVSRRAVAAAVVFVSLAVAACSRGSGGQDEARRPIDPAECAHRALFAGLADVIGRLSLCPSWLPDGRDARVLTSHASDDPPAYLVELGPNHVILSFGADDLPGDVVESLEVDGEVARVLFNAAGTGQAGLHSGHYALELPVPNDSRGVYSVSLHGTPWQSRQQNVRTLVRIAEALAPVPTD